MCAALPLSRACATVCDPVPAATFIQKLTELSVNGAGRALARAWNCCAAFENSRPNAPACAATRNVYAVPFVRPVTLYIVPVEPVRIGVCAFAPMYGVIL